MILLREKNNDECATKRVFGYSTLLFIAAIIEIGAINLFSFLSGFHMNSLFLLQDHGR